MKKFLIMPALIVALLIGQVANAAFSDVSENTSYTSSIDWMTENGVIQGYPDGTFKPDQCVNRAEFLKMMYLTLGKNIIVEDGFAGSNYYDNFFNDTSTDEWYWPYVEQALRDEAIEGYPDGTFKPGQCVNRAEALKMAVLGFEIYDENAGGDRPDIYVDVMPGNNWFDAYIYSAIDRNAVGKDHVTMDEENHIFYPGDSMTRKEVAEMLYRIKTLTDNEVFGYVDTMEPDDLNYYVSPSNGVSFLMPDGWWVIHDDFYETAEGGTSYYPTILINGPSEAGEVTVAINQRLMDCADSSMQCYDITDNYKIGSNNPSLEVSYLINRIMLTFREGEIPETITEVAFDGCGNPSDYANEEWWVDFVNAWDAYLITLSGTVPVHEALQEDVGDYCLALDKSMFIFIPDYYENDSGQIFKYDINSGVVEMAQSEGDYYPIEFGARNGNYIPVTGYSDVYECNYVSGNYYYLENRVELSAANTCIN